MTSSATNSKNFDLRVKGFYTEDNFEFPEINLALIIPAFNEEKNIGNVLSKIPKNLCKNVDIIVVDDGSHDETVKVASKFNSIILSHKTNKGNGAATITGLNYCKEKNKYDIVIIIDADGQHDPAFIPHFMEAINERKVDFVIGNRFEFFYQMSPFRKICSKLLTVFYLILFRKIISDPSNGYRALSKKLISNLKFESYYSVTQEMLFKVLPNFKFTEIPIKLYTREEGKSFLKIKNYFWKMLLSFVKFYVFPRVSFITSKLFSDKFKSNLGNGAFKT